MARFAALKYAVAYSALSLWLRVYQVYKFVKKRDWAKYAVIVGIIAITCVLLWFRDPATTSKRLNFDPYQLLEVSRTATNREVQKSYRQKSLIYHPDRNPDPEAREIFIKLTQSRDILVDEKKRANYDQFGDPDGDPYAGILDMENIPDWLRFAGKKFVAFYGILFAILIILPIAFLVVHPGVKNPPTWLTNPLFSTLATAEESMSNNDDISGEKYLANAQSQWNALCKSFPKYKKSYLAPAIEFRITARLAQIRIAKQDVTGAIALLTDLRKTYKNDLKATNVTNMTKTQLKDLSASFGALTLSKITEKQVSDLLQSFEKK